MSDYDKAVHEKAVEYLNKVAVVIDKIDHVLDVVSERADEVYDNRTVIAEQLGAFALKVEGLSEDLRDKLHDAKIDAFARADAGDPSKAGTETKTTGDNYRNMNVDSLSREEKIAYLIEQYGVDTNSETAQVLENASDLQLDYMVGIFKAHNGYNK